MNRSEHVSSTQVGRWIFICVVGLGIMLLVATAAVTVAETETGESPDCGAVSFAENDEGQFEIENVSQLQCIGEHNLDGEYVVTADIDASDTENWNSGSGFDPIGDSGNEFTGTFDGDGHTISNLYIGRPDGSNVGLFGHSTGDLSNVALERVDIEGEGGLNEGVGALAGRSEGAVSNVTVSGTVDGNERVGGLIGTIRGDGTVSVSSASVTVNATGNFAGGLVGESWGDIWNSYATGDVDGDNQVGGLVGFNDSGDIWNSYATGDVDGDNQVGGLVGENLGDIWNSYWDRGTTNQEDAIGEDLGSDSGVEGFGLTSDTDPADEMTGGDAESNMGSLAFSITWETVTADDADASDDSYPILTALDRQSQLEALGVNEFGWIEDWYDLDDVRDNLDGNYTLLEELDESTVGYDDVASDTANDGDGFDPIGDSGNEFTGHFDGAGHTISDLYIDREDSVGLFGYVGNGSGAGTVENIGLEDVDVNGGSQVGALIGYNDGTVVNASADGTTAGHFRVGGLVGYNAGLVTSSYSSGYVLDNNGLQIGGLVGRNDESGSIDTAYSTATVTGINIVGGVVGDNSGDVTETYATGSLSADDEGVGGIAGQNQNQGDIENAYWDVETTNSGDAVGTNDGTSDATGLTTAEMKGTAVIETMDSFDFESTWWVRISPDEYPGLRAFENGLDPTIDSTNDPVNEGETLSVDVTVTNTDATERTQDVTLSVDGEAVDIEEGLTVSGDDSQQLTLNWKTESGDAGEHDIVVTTADTADVATVQVNETHSVSGTVEDTTFETGIGNVVVTISGDPGEFTAETDENGEYTVENVPGSGESYDVIVDPVGWEVASTTTTVDGENVTGVDIEITGDASNKVTLRDWVTDALLEGGTMTAEHESFGAADVTTDENGEAEITIPGGFDYDFTYSKAGYNDFEPSYSFDPGDGASRSYVLGGNAEIAGEISENRTGEGIEGATVTANKGTGAYEATTESDGTYTIENVAGGAEYDVETGADGYETTTSPDEFVESESTHSVDLELAGAATVEGTVTDALTGATIENANLTLVYPSGEEFTFEKATEADGSFAVAEVPAIDDEFTLLASATVDEGFGIANETAFNPAITTTQNLMLGPEYEGDGIETSPYEIHDAEDLQQMRYNLTAHYELQDDIDASGTSDWFGEDGFDPIGEFDDEFNGSFDGNGHAIENLTIDREDENYVGLFGAVQSAGTLKNVSLENVDIVGDTTVGGLAGETGGDVRNISVTGTVSGTGGFVGGLTGLNFDGEVVDVTTSADVEGASFVGGLVGESQDEIRSVTVSGDVAGEGNVGGLIGNSVTNSNITDAVATGTVNGTGEAVGGLVGLQVDGVITRSTATGSVNGDLDTGGLVGQNNGALITESTATGDVAGNEFGTGGLVGWNNGGTVSNASASGNVEGNEFVGGLIGENMGTVTASYAVGAVDDEESADVSGGLVGENSGDVTDSYWDVETTGQDTSDGSPDENGLTTDQMTGLNVTENMAAFEFLDGDGKWHVTDSYPALAWEDTEPFFGVNITETNSPVVSGETLTVTTTVTNWADDGTQTVTLTDTGFADEQQDDEVVTLDSGESAEGLTFEWETDESDGGTGAVTVASEDYTDSVSVEIGDPVVTNVDTGEQYVTVQGAIDAANAGETLEIETGTFEQSFEIDESLTLRGQGSGDDGTTLEADSGTIAEITAVGVTVEDLVMNGTSGGETAIDVASGATDTTVQHVSFEGFETPIVVFGDDADIRENDLDGADVDGIALDGVDGGTVENNTVKDSGRYGIFLEDSQAVVVSDNDLVDNGDGEYRELYPRDEDEIDGPADSGIALWETTHSTVEANTMTGNNRFGISAVQSSHNEYLDNVVEVDGTNKGGGIHLGVDSSENTISGSTITVTSGTVSVDWDSNLIYVVTGENNLVTDNELDGERTRGIFIQLSSNAVVENNTIAGLYGHGIQIDQRDYLADPSLGFYAANPGPATVANNSLEDVAVETKEFSSSDVGASGLYLYSDHAVETRNNTGTESGPDIQIGLSEQSVENQSITTSAGETTMSFEGEGQVDGLEEQPNPERPEGLASTGYYFEIEDFVFENDRFDLATITYDASFENLEFAYDEAALMDDGTILPDTLSLWRFDGNEWIHIEDSAVDTDQQVITGNVTESGTVGVFGAGFADGDGSADAPFEIENWNHLDNVRHSLDANFTLGNELNASTDGYDDVASEIANDGGGFEPIGDSDDAFTGTFDGDGQTIAEFVIDRRGTGNDQGMFGMIGTDGTVTNLVMADVDVAGLNRVGGLVAENNGTITDVAITGTVEGSTNVAGVVGRNEGGLLERLDVDVAIESSSGPVGGLVGTNWGGTIRDSITRGDIEATGAWQGAGGAFSRLYDSSQISNVTALGNVTQSPDGASQDSGAGGFASLATSSAEINDSIAEGDVDAEGRAGGFIGRLSGTVTNSAASGTVTGGGEVGGFVGESSGSLSTVFATGEVIGVDEVGGLVGKNDNGDISESYATGNVTGNYDVAGLVGVNEGEVSESYATGGVDEDESASTTGGLVADNHGTVTNSYWDTESTGQTSSAGSPDEYGLTTAEMTGLSVTENMEGFVFPNSEGTWHVTDSYPALAWEDTDPFFGVNITETNSPIEAGTVLNVTAELTNWAADGEQTVTLSDTEFSDGEQDFQSVALDSGQDEELILEWETETSNVGTGDVTVASENDTDRAAVTIEAVVETIDAQVTDDNATADGEDTVTFTVSVEDADTNPIEGLTIEVLDSEDVNELGGIEPGDTNQTDEGGETTFTANSTDIGQFTVEFEEQQNENAATATATFVAGTPANISFDADPTDETVTADGAAAITYTVTVEDGFENPVEGVDVEADATAGSDVELNDDGETTTATTNADGEVTVAATSTTAQEAVEITFTEQDESNNATGSATFEVGAPDQIDAEVTVDNAVADGDDEVEFTVTITDANDNPIEDATVDVSDDAGLDDLAAEQETNPDGEAVFTATSTDSGAFTVTFSEDDAGEDTATATFVAGAPGQIDAEVSVDNAVANGEDAVEFTVTVTDDSANPVEGATVTVGDSEDVGDLGSIDAGDDAETDADGQVTFTATSTEPGAFTVAFSEDDAGTDTATATFVALEGGVDTLDIAGEGEQAVIASGTDHPISAEVSNEADIAGEFEVTLTIETETAVELRETVNTTALEPGENETVTFSNVTPELDILGMTESYGVTVSAGGANATGELVVNPDVTGNGEPARDVTGDGLFDNVNGDREDGEDVVNIADVQALFQNLDNPTLQEFAPRFNFAGANPDRVTVFDVQGLFTRLTDLGD